MVSKGLKPGDTFTDGKLLYKVISVDEVGNYVSSLVGLASEEAKPKKKVVVAKVIDEVTEEVKEEPKPKKARTSKSKMMLEG